MNTKSVFGLVSIVAIVAVGAGCSAPDPTGSPYKSGKAKTAGDNTSSSGGGDDDGTTPTPTPTPSQTTPTTPEDPTTPTTPPVVDTFCDDAKTIPGSVVLNDTLASEKGFFTVAEGFTQTSWAFDGTALRQGRLADAVDNLVFNKDAAISDVTVEVRASSTEVSGTITPRLRQMFILVGSTIANGQLSAVGCGVEVVQGQTVEQKTSVVRFSGTPDAITTNPIERVNRASLQANEEFGMKARLSKGTLTCEVTQAATTTATATNLGTVTGSVAFFTRQTKALFKNAKICKLK